MGEETETEALHKLLYMNKRTKLKRRPLGLKAQVVDHKDMFLPGGKQRHTWTPQVSSFQTCDPK